MNENFNNIDPIKKAELLVQEADEIIKKHGQSAFGRYPLLFSLLGTFGLAAVIYGFEGTISSVPFIGDRPFLILIIGLILLSITGSLYRKL